MPDNDAEEITIVLKDGTVSRWEGDAARRFYTNASLSDTSWCDERERPTVTKPLRRVTEIWGSYSSLNNEIIEDDGRALFAVTLRDLMPTSLTPRRAKIRITVEAVEEKDR